MTTAKESELSQRQSHANSKSLFAGTGKDRDMAKVREGNRRRGDTHEGLSGEHYGERCLESAGKEENVKTSAVEGFAGDGDGT